MRLSWWWKLRRHARKQLNCGAFRFRYILTCFTISVQWWVRYLVVVEKCMLHSRSQPVMMVETGLSCQVRLERGQRYRKQLSTEWPNMKLCARLHCICNVQQAPYAYGEQSAVYVERQEAAWLVGSENVFVGNMKPSTGVLRSAFKDDGGAKWYMSASSNYSSSGGQRERNVVTRKEYASWGSTAVSTVRREVVPDIHSK